MYAPLPAPPSAPSPGHRGALFPRRKQTARSVSLTRSAAARIREAIVAGRLEFGESLSETQLAAALGMSKAPVRAALIELREKGLVTIAPQAGTFVCSPTAEDIANLSSFRFLMERECMRCALARGTAELLAALDETVALMVNARQRRSGADYKAADTAYHLAFVYFSGNRVLQQAYDLIGGIVEALRVRLFDASRRFQEKSFSDHVAILAALRAGDLEEATRILEDHIMRTRQLLEASPPTQTARGPRANRTCEDYRELFRLDAERHPSAPRHRLHVVELQRRAFGG